MPMIFQPRIQHYVRAYVFWRICETESDLRATSYLTLLLDFSFLHGKGTFKTKKYPGQPHTRKSSRLNVIMPHNKTYCWYADSRKNTLRGLCMHDSASSYFPGYSMLRIPLGVIRTTSDMSLVHPKLQKLIQPKLEYWRTPECTCVDAYEANDST